MPSKPVRYHLRFQIIPGKNVRADARVLAKFCRKHGVEEVVLFFAGEEWNNGLLSAREENVWFDTVKKAKAVLEKAGVTVSLNPWMTVLHCARGRRFPAGRRFSPMVSPGGEVSKACASLADPKWRDYIYRLYGRFAKLGFRVIWVEDDFRFHNHTPLEWGGGFETDVLKRFARKIGRKAGRDEVVKNILKPGRPHLWRVKWMETWREIQLEVAAGLAGAVAKSSPGETMVGLMSSHPSHHSTEGRDWRRLFDAFSINGRVAQRPHFAHYGEAPGTEKGYSIMMLDIQKNFRRPSCEVAPEVENFPYTHWTKSDTLTWAEMALCMFNGSDALLLNLFPFTGNPAGREPRVGELLDRSRPGLEWISARFSKDLRTCGIGMPWREDAQAHVRTARGESMGELDATPFQAGRLLMSYGVPVSANTQNVNAVFGSLVWAFRDEEIHHMLSNGLMLDGVSADILCRRGFGQHIGVDFRGWVEREEGKYSVEVVASRNTGAPRGHCFGVNLLERLAMMEPRKGASEWTTIITPEKKRFGAGIVVHKNKLGGRVVTYAAPDPACLARDYHRQAVVQNAVCFMGGGTFVSAVATGGAHLMPIHFKGAGRNYVVILNGSPDAAKPSVRIGDREIGAVRATLLSPLAKPVSSQVRIIRGKKAVTVVSLKEVPYLGFLVLELCGND